MFRQEIVAQTITDPSILDRSYDERKLAKASTSETIETTNFTSHIDSRGTNGNSRAGCGNAFIPRDASYTSVPRNDDGSFGPLALGFGFSFCGTTYTNVWINTNGNLTFTGAFGIFTPTGFPIGTPMVAPFWADVDTRPICSGLAYYKLFSDHLIVTWDQVGYFNNQCDKLNTFQVIISNGTAALPGGGNNVEFRYGDMQWTTGSASGGVGGFGGSPATVGFNAGGGINFEQVGRFDHAGSDYDGPFGINDGVSYLDANCFLFNSASDADGDGVTDCFDCNDNNPEIYPGQTEICDGIDNNCTGGIDEGFDQDGDTYTTCEGDCNDDDANINPGAEEICDDIDNNCDGSVDEGFTNTDGDNQADCVDTDDDNDGCLDGDDSNPLEYSGDSDCDSVHDDCDICPSGDDSLDNNEDGIPDCSQLLAYEDYSSEWYCASNKIAICHNGNTICVSENALPAHFNHGDNIGPCPSCEEDQGAFMNPVITSDEITGIDVFPNPATDHLVVQFEELKESGNMIILDQFNRIVWKGKLNPGQRLEELHLSDHRFNNGMFIVQIDSDNMQMTKRFIIHK